MLVDQASAGTGFAASLTRQESVGIPARPHNRKGEVNMTRNKGAMTVAEAGRRGGATTAQRHGPEFYEQIG